jgi:Fe-S-cluster-containing dehydrogenase component
MSNRELSRRRFLGLALAGGAASTVGRSLAGNVAHGDGEEAVELTGTAYALVIDTTKCTGCQACVQACNLRNELADEQSYIRGEVQGDEHLTWYLMVQCQHCADPPCATVCPTNATYVRDDAVVLIDEKLCVGCKYCIYACPYDARIYDPARGVADKCWLCLDWVLGGGEPACVQACIPGARLFGRLDDVNSEVRKLVDSGQAKPLHPEFGTAPAVLKYVIEDPAAQAEGEAE